MDINSTEDALEQSRKELSRADHLLFVSLKYTRTVDVLKSLIERLISSMAFSNQALLMHLKDKKKLAVVPELPRSQVEILRKDFSNNSILLNFVDFYLLLRKLDKAEYARSSEFRRHVTMTATVEGKKMEITIDIITDYFNKAKEYLIFAANLINPPIKE